MKTPLLHDDVQTYIEDLYHHEVDPLEDSIIAKTQQEFGSKVRILSGRSVGKLLTSYVYLLQPKQVVEVGTFTGFGTYSLLKQLPHASTLITIEHQQHVQEIAKGLLKDHPKFHQVKFILDDALHAIQNINDPIDLSFIDANKKAYLQHYTLIKQKTRKSGVILVDNTLFHGTVLSPDNDLSMSIHNFNLHVAKDDEVMASFVPIRDGIWIIVKK